MIRRTFLQTLGGLVAGAFVSNIAAIYSPGRPWEVAVPEPPMQADSLFGIPIVYADHLSDVVYFINPAEAAGPPYLLGSRTTINPIVRNRHSISQAARREFAEFLETIKSPGETFEPVVWHARCDAKDRLRPPT